MQMKDLGDVDIDPAWGDILDANLELFPGLPVDEIFADFLEDLDMWPDARELRNHDCMWAGLCVSDKHERESSTRPERIFMPTTPKRPKVVAPTSARSVLLPPPPRLPDRPDTPLSDTDTLDLDLPVLCDLLEDLPAVVPSEVTGQIAVPPQITRPAPKVPPCTVTSYATLMVDHCYYTTLPPDHPVHTDNLLTPSDSEEEIDVETVADARKPVRNVYSSPASSPSICGSLPTDPTPQDRRDLQRTVSSIMRHGRPTLRDRRRHKRRLSSEDTVESGRKAMKRKQYRRISTKSKRRRLAPVRHSSSDSEMESTERRSLHNNLERQRRIDLRNAFEELRQLVPETMDSEKAAKVVILNAGARYCQDLTYTQRALLNEKAVEKRKQEQLREHLAHLRRCAAQRR